MIEVRDLTKIYKNKKSEVKAVDQVSFSIQKGEVVGLLGPNGAGKTTTIKCLCGLIIPTSGKIMLDDKDCLKNPKLVRENISAVFEGNRNIYWRLTVEGNLRFFAGLMGKENREMVDELIESFDLSEKRKTEARLLSRGMQQRLAIACALMRDTPIVLLDEPTLGLDVPSSYALRETIKALATDHGKTLLLSSHDMHVVEEVCERVIIINHGKLIADNKVSDLFSLFRNREYKIILENTLKSSLIDRIKKDFNGQISVIDKKTEINVQVPTSEKFFLLMDTLKVENCIVNSVREDEPDLEKIFVKIVGGG